MRRTWKPKLVENVPTNLDLAADHLRRFYSNVHSCSIRMTLGKTWGEYHNLPNKGRGLYYVEGVGVVTNEGMLRLARKHGHDAPLHQLPPNWKD